MIERGVLARCVTRAAFLWLLLRLVVVAAAAAGDGTAALPPRLALLSSAIILAAVIGMVRTDVRVLRERVFLANLGVGTSAITGITALTAGMLEIMWAVLV